MHFINRYKLEIVVFVSGAVLMILELVGSRILAPYLGTTIIVWTSLIGVILGSLSLGYWYGGRLADKNPRKNILARILYFSALTIGITAFIKDPVLLNIKHYILDMRIASFLSAFILFSPASMLMGMVSPYAVKLKMLSLKKAGRTTGNLYAVSTIGSIVGTFLGGFYLIAYLGNIEIIYLSSIIMFLLALFLDVKILQQKIHIFLMFIFLSVSFFNFYMQDQWTDKNIIFEGESLYNSIRIVNYYYQDTRPVRYLMVNNAIYSAMYLDNKDELVFDYTKFYHFASFFNPQIKKALMIGGAAYSYPMAFLKKFPESYIDVVEIDPTMTILARKYFGLIDDPRLKIFITDGRIYLNETKEKYDAILIDAFNGYNVPYHLTTKEVVEKMMEILSQNGVVITNIVSSINNPFLQAEYLTYKKVFPKVFIFPLEDKKNRFKIQNIMLVAAKSEEPVLFSDQAVEMFIGKDVKILTDNFAPVDYYMLSLP